MFLADSSLTGQVAEIHGDGTGAEDGGGGSGGVTIRPPHEFVDEASERNIEAFWGLGMLVLYFLFPFSLVTYCC